MGMDTDRCGDADADAEAGAVGARGCAAGIRRNAFARANIFA